VLFFDEADAIASRRFTQMDHGYQREANAVVNVLLREVEEFSGVIVFATNLAANFDPAFERRIRTHILFEMPGPDEREKIWRAQLHARKTPLAPDVDFRALADRFPVSGGDIKNAVLKAAQAAISEPGDDAAKQISQHHFEQAMEEVVAAKRVMDQSLFGSQPGSNLPMPWSSGTDVVPGDDLRDDLSSLAARVVDLEDTVVAVPEGLRRIESTYDVLSRRIDQLVSTMDLHRDASREAVTQAEKAWEGRFRVMMVLVVIALVVAIAAGVAGVMGIAR
jgi:hypothetical protein